MHVFRTLAVAGALALAPALIQAQLIVSTNTSVSAGRDQQWFSATRNANGASLSSYVAEFSSNRTANWVMPSADGSFANPRGGFGVEYSLRTSLTLTAGDQLSVTIRCLTDNIWGSLLINGNAFAAGACSSINSAPISQFTIASSFFQTGMNTLDFRYTGDGITDGAEVVVLASTFTPGNPGTPGVVPEPSTYALMATGFAGLLGVTRRRRHTR